MDLSLTEEQKMTRDTVADFARKEVARLAPQLDSEERHPSELLAKMARLGLMGITVPSEYGGAGAGTVSYAIAVAGLARACASTAVIWMLADMATEIDAAWSLVLRAAWLKDSGQGYTKEAAMAKLFASDIVVRAARTAVQILGGYGYTRDYPVERHFRDAKATELYEGTSEIMRLVISRALLR